MKVRNFYRCKRDTSENCMRFMGSRQEGEGYLLACSDVLNDWMARGSQQCIDLQSTSH
jgi:hypothetical protein